jgi:uncharacterized protein (TIGR03437 family)
VNGHAAGYLYNPQQNTFNSVPSSVTFSDTALRALARKPGDELTFTCVPPGSGAGIAVEPVIGLGPVTTSAGLVSAANPIAGSAIAPGGMASLYGTNLANAKLPASGAPLPLLLGGTSMTVDNLPAALFYVSPLQINFQVPWISISKPTQFPLLITQGEGLTIMSFMLTPYAPALFTANGQGSGQASAIISNTTSPAAPTGAYPGSRPAKPGEFVLLYCTGLGAVTNPPATGDVSPSNPPAATLTTPTLKLGGASVPVSFSGLAPNFVGLYQVNFQIPANATGGSGVPLVLSIGGVSSNTATIAIQ